MKWFLLICFLSLVLSTTGCGTTLFTSKVGKEISQQELENFRENVLSSKKSIIKTCGCQTGMMQGLFGERYGIDLPNSYQKAAVEYDNLCRSFPNSNYEEKFKVLIEGRAFHQNISQENNDELKLLLDKVKELKKADKVGAK